MTKPPVGLREAGKAERLRRLKEATKSILLEHGYEQATTRDISQAAGVSIGTLFVYAKDKRDLVYLVINDELDPVARHAHANVTAGGSPLDAICAFPEALVRLFRREPGDRAMRVQRAGLLREPSRRRRRAGDPSACAHEGPGGPPRRYPAGRPGPGAISPSTSRRTFWAARSTISTRPAFAPGSSRKSRAPRTGARDCAPSSHCSSIAWRRTGASGRTVRSAPNARSVSRNVDRQTLTRKLSSFSKRERILISQVIPPDWKALQGASPGGKRPAVVRSVDAL